MRFGVRFFLLLLAILLSIDTAKGQGIPVRIWPVGDSITEGCCSGTLIEGGYRTELFTLLQNAGYAPEFVGSLRDLNPPPALTYPEHDGHPGYRIDQVDAQIESWRSVIADPDVVLLLIGVNDFGQNYDTVHAINRLQRLIEHIVNLEPYAKVIVANLTQWVGNPQADNLLQSQYNNLLPGVVNYERSFGRKVYFTNLRNCCGVSDFSNDGLHPNLTGYNDMGRAWFQAVTNAVGSSVVVIPPAILRAEGQLDLRHVVITFNKPLSDSSANVANFALSGGLRLAAADLDSSKRVITLTTSIQNPLTTYTVNVSGITDRAAPQNVIASGTSISFLSGPATEAANYTLVYSIDLSDAANYAATGVPYQVDNHATIGSFSRVAYYLELQPDGGGSPQKLWVSMDAFTSDPGKLGVPTFESGAFFQQTVSHMNVRSSVPGIVTGDNISTGNIEFWWGDYDPHNSVHIAGASETKFDWGDSASFNDPPGHGSMQVHNFGAGQTLFAYNGWNEAPQISDLGIGNFSGTNPDWTAAANANTYLTKRLQVYVLPVPATCVLTVHSVNPAQALSVGVTPADQSGATAGVTGFARVYSQGTAVTVTAPPTAGATKFAKWQKDGVDLSTNPSVSVTMDVSHTLTAVYVSGADAVNYVAEASNYKLVYSLLVPTQADFSHDSVPYEVDSHSEVGPFSRIAYFLELQSGLGGQLQYVWVSMDAFTADAAKIGVPTLASGAVFQQRVSKLNVRSSVSGILTGDGLATGNIEFWPYGYRPQNTVAVPNASDSVDDWGDTVNLNDPAGYGSMQVHNWGARQTVFALNGWCQGYPAVVDVGIGNAPTQHPDWTHAENSGSYTTRKLQVYVLPTYVLTVNSINPSSGVGVAISPGGLGGVSSGTVVHLAAPSTAGGNTFLKWQTNGVDFSTSSTVSFAMNGNYTATAVYASQVLAEYLFYNNSLWDGNNPGPNPNDDNAIAVDKVSLHRGGIGAFKHFSSYSRGINGVMVDLSSVLGTLAASDFMFQIGNDNNPHQWGLAPAPSSITVRHGAGVNGSDRVTLIWPDHTIQGQWLRVTVLATSNTGLSDPYDFFFGNAVGKSGDSVSHANVTSQDTFDVLDHLGLGVSVTNPFDHDRDGQVLVNDALIALTHRTSGASALQLINLSSSAPASAPSNPVILSPSMLQAATPTGTATNLVVATPDNERIQAAAASGRLRFLYLNPDPNQEVRVRWTADLKSGQWQDLPSSWGLLQADGLTEIEVPVDPSAPQGFFRFEPQLGNNLPLAQ